MRRALERLVDQGLVLVEAAGPSNLYRANRSHLLWPAIEQIVRAAEDVPQRLTERITDVVIDQLGPEVASRTTLALFGSVARDQSTSESDLDVLAVFPDDADEQSRQDAVDAIIQCVPEWTGNPCSVYAVDASGFQEIVERDDPLLSSWKVDAKTFHGPDLWRTVAAPY